VVRRHRNVWKLPLAALNFQVPEEHQSDTARNKVKQWQSRKDADQWKPVWVMGPDHKPWPVFVRLASRPGEDSGIHDSQFAEVFEWEPDMQPDPGNPPQLIIGGPPANKGGLFHLPPVKL